jgi:hypothetical protein
MFYPGCGLDFHPFNLLGNRLHSYVYSDFGLQSNNVAHAIRNLPGYEVVLFRNVEPAEFGPVSFDEQPWRERPGRSPPDEHLQPPFAFWVILQQKPEVQNAAPSEPISLLYIGGDAIATFQALYLVNNAAPAVIGLIQYGYGWTDFRDPNEPLADAVLANPAGIPKLLLEGGVGDATSYQQPCWPLFSKLICSESLEFGNEYRLWCRR